MLAEIDSPSFVAGFAAGIGLFMLAVSIIMMVSHKPKTKNYRRSPKRY